MSEPTLVFPPDPSDSSVDAAYPPTSSAPDPQALGLLHSRSGLRDDSLAPPTENDHDSSDDPNDFSFSFNEEDLIPKKTSWSGSHRNDFYEPVVDPRDLSDSSSTFYSRAPDFQADSKITVQRTLYVSEQQKAAAKRANEVVSSSSSRDSLHDTDVAPKPKQDKRAVTNFARKQRPTRNASRSPEKSGGEDMSRRESPERSKVASRSKDHPRGPADHAENTGQRPEKYSFRRTRSLLGRRNKLASPDSRSDAASRSGLATPPRNPSPSKRPMTPILKTFSNTSLTSFGLPSRRSTEIPPVPGAVDAEKYRSTGTPAPKKRDELWTVFRSLESDANKFAAKATGQKATFARTTLFPFLRNYAKHPSNKSIRPEDVDRRTNILNKWWTGLIEMLSPKNYQHVAGSDRPYVLEAITSIMERPEWRVHPSPFCPLVDRMHTSASVSEETRSATAAEASEMMIESVQRSLRNMFVQNIFSQMSFAVDKMCLRSTPVSLVAFCGKTCAYAFFFCPGIADILLRLWDVKLLNVQRILQANGLGRGTQLPDFSDTIGVNFPQAVRHLAFSSTKALSLSLKTTPATPVGAGNVPWNGHWVNRWSGGDSDLFYVFTRNFHVLLSDFLPEGVSKEEKLSAPGVVLVYAQLLSNLDTTIHRGTLQSAADGTSDVPVTFDSLLAADDSAAIPMQTPPANSARQAAENRLILLLKDVLLVKGTPAKLFVESFCNLLKAAAESTSLYNHDSCFTLCDVIQEAIALLINYQAELSQDERPLDWPFWLNVFKQMVASQSTTTEIRLYALLFSIWNDLTADETRKRQLCLDFLLEAKHFHHSFNHWCPMVRTYFMRLLCWRVARYDGKPSDVDLEILQTLSARLRLVWSHHKYLVSQAKSKGQLLPSTAPCNPAPGRKLLIIRTDNPISSSFMMFDNMTLSGSSSESSRPDSPPPESVSESISMSASSFLDRITSGLETIDTPKKRGSLFRSLLGYKSSDSPARSESPKPPAEDRQAEKPSPASSRDSSPDRRSGSRNSMYEQRPSMPLPKGSTGAPKPPPKAFAQAFFKFSLEAVDRRPHNLPSNLALDAPRLPLAAQVLLQSQEGFLEDLEEEEPRGDAALDSRYAGRALAEWIWAVNECQNFFERRRNEGVPNNKLVETPALSVETFRKPN